MLEFGQRLVDRAIARQHVAGAIALLAFCIAAQVARRVASLKSVRLAGTSASPGCGSGVSITSGTMPLAWIDLPLGV